MRCAIVEMVADGIAASGEQEIVGIVVESEVTETKYVKKIKKIAEMK